MTQSFGESVAKQFADAHEVGNWYLETYGKNSPKHKAMDLYNNEVGRGLVPQSGCK